MPPPTWYETFVDKLANSMMNNHILYAMAAIIPLAAYVYSCVTEIVAQTGEPKEKSKPLTRKQQVSRNRGARKF